MTPTVAQHPEAQPRDNQTQRVIGADTYDLKYDAEGRLIEVKKNSAVFATFTYDGDGNRVVGTVSGVTVAYVGDHYEKEGSTIRKYYRAAPPQRSGGGYAGGQRIAMRSGSTLSWLLTDHLGSTAITASAVGAEVGELRYRAWGETRYASGATPTTWRYTGQREEAGFGLYYYRARWYDPALGRFAQADTIGGGDRYAYGSNNPLRYTDPTGHCIDGITTIPCLMALIAITGFAGGAAVYEFNVSGHSWWESADDATATLEAGLEGAALAVVAALTAGQAALVAPDAAMYLGSKTGNASLFQWGAARTASLPPAVPGVRGDRSRFWIDDWSSYPKGPAPRPNGPFRLVEGEEYYSARSAAYTINDALHRRDPGLEGLHIHEIKPVKFGGDPTDLTNKIALPREVHLAYTLWWSHIQRLLEGK